MFPTRRSRNCSGAYSAARARPRCAPGASNCSPGPCTPAARGEPDITARQVAAIGALTPTQRATVGARYDAAAALLRRELLVALRTGDLPADAVVWFATADPDRPDTGLLQLAVGRGSGAARR